RAGRPRQAVARVLPRRRDLVPAVRRRRLRGPARPRPGPRPRRRPRRVRLARGRAPRLRRGPEGRRHRSRGRSRGHERSPRCAQSGRRAAERMIQFTSEQESFRRSVARFVDAEVMAAADAIDERAEFPTALFRRVGELGYLGLRYPEAYGGAGADMVTYCLFAEELARGSLSVAAAAAMQSLMGTYFVYKYGSEPLRQRYLVPALRGDLIATFALTEPNAGSDVANITTRAHRRGDRYVLRGTKTWVTSA